MERFLDYVLRQLVEFPDEVVIIRDDTSTKTVFRLQMRKSDVGKVVGKHGQTISAIRNLMDAAAAKHGGRATVEILDENGRTAPA
jgi:predicted RNA-binding protein YlqC (UPF0109 family)